MSNPGVPLSEREVEEETAVGLVETMKMFNAVHAGTTGVITQICVQDATRVEYGQVLSRMPTT